MHDKEYMERAIELAKKGAGWTSPNPLVGAVVIGSRDPNPLVSGKGAAILKELKS